MHASFKPFSAVKVVIFLPENNFATCNSPLDNWAFGSKIIEEDTILIWDWKIFSIVNKHTNATTLLKAAFHFDSLFAH